MKLKKMLTTFLAVMAAGALLAGCGGGAKSEKSAASAPGQISGQVATDGSTSMEKVIGGLGEAYKIKNPQVKFTYNPTGSGAGIKAAADGRCDIGLSSRRLKEGEKQKGLKETVLALDGIAVVVNKENGVADISLKQLAEIYTGKINDWAQLGGRPGAIVVIGREAGSGTRDGFESVTKTAGKCKYGQELTSTGDVIATVAANPQAVGYTSLVAVKNTVKVLSIGGVIPSEKMVKSGDYPLQRPFVLVTKDGRELSAAAKGFVEFAFSADGAAIIKKAGAIAK